MEDNNNTSKEVSLYNEAGMQIMRLHNYWVRADRYANGGDLKQWKFILDTIWRELYSDVLRSPNSDGYLKTDKKLKKKLAECKNRNLLYHLLDERHRFLKEIQDSSGKGGIYGDKDSGELD